MLLPVWSFPVTARARGSHPGIALIFIFIQLYRCRAITAIQLAKKRVNRRDESLKICFPHGIFETLWNLIYFSGLSFEPHFQVLLSLLSSCLECEGDWELSLSCRVPLGSSGFSVRCPSQAMKIVRPKNPPNLILMVLEQVGGLISCWSPLTVPNNCQRCWRVELRQRSFRVDIRKNYFTNGVISWSRWS